MCIVLYIYRSAKFSVAVFKHLGSIDGGSICHGYMCIVLYRSAMRCAKFGVAVFKVSLFNWGVNLQWVYMNCSIHKDLPSLV